MSVGLQNLFGEKLYVFLHSLDKYDCLCEGPGGVNSTTNVAYNYLQVPALPK